MEKLTKDISEIIYNDIKALNEKVMGLNFLELLKESILEKISKLLGENTFPLQQTINYQSEINEFSRNIKISINYFINSISISKKIISSDSLIISFNESTNFDIYQDDKKFNSILLYKNTGISIPKNTLINSKYNKNLLLIEIMNKEIEEPLTKQKKI